MRLNLSASYRIYFLLALVVVFFALFTPSQPHAAEPVPVFTPTGDGKETLASYLEYFEDPVGNFSINDVVSGRAGNFQPLAKHNDFGYKYRSKALWLRFAVDASHYKRPSWFLSYDHQHIGNMQVYYQTSSGLQKIELDERLPLEGRVFPVREYVMEIPTVAQTTYYYVRLAPHTRYLKAEFSWAGTSGILESIHNYQLVYGLFFGGLIVMWAYNVALYVTLRDRSYLYYVYYFGCFSATFFHIYGLSALFIRLNYFFEQLFAAAAYGAIHGMVLFTRHFLTLRSTSPWLDRYLHCFQWILFVGGCAVFIQPIGRPFNTLNYLILMVLPVIVFSGLKRWYQGYSPACVFSAGWAIFGVGLGLLSLRSVGLLPANIITDNAVMVASVAEAVIFSVALAFRIKLIERQKNDALDGERALLERRVADRTKSLQASLESRSMILANAAHELRSPVNALRLLVDATALNLERGASHVISNVQAIAAHMAQLVDNLLLLDLDQPVPRSGGPIQQFDLGSEIAATARLIGPLRQGSLASFEIDVSGCMGVMVKGDITSLRRIIINLLSNAFKFTEHGRVVLTASHATDETSRKVTAVVRVADTGEGIPANMHEQIFLPFITTNSRSSGTGLGLSISRKLAAVMGGSLELVRSAEDSGSDFECTVQFDMATGPDAAVAVAGNEISPKRLRILLAEDDPITAHAVQLIVRQLRHEVVHVASIAELNRELMNNGERFDVALVDNRLPGGYGIDVIRRCREMGLALETRKLLMTADVTPAIMEAAGAVECEIVTKPTTAAYLRTLLGVGPILAPAEPTVVLEPGPLTMLRASGASMQELRKLCVQFAHAVEEALSELRSILQARTESASDTDAALQIVHRVRSSCATIGAVALGDAFNQLTSSYSSGQVQGYYEQIMHRNAATQAAVNSLLNELAARGEIGVI